MLAIGVAVNIEGRVQRWRLLVITRLQKKLAPGQVIVGVNLKVVSVL